MNKAKTILVVDRNPNVRGYLKRELRVDGYNVRLAESSRDVIECIRNDTKIDLFVIDPDLPDTDVKPLFKKLQRLRPRIPVVIHTLTTDYLSHYSSSMETTLVEKDGNSIDRLKHVIKQRLM